MKLGRVAVVGAGIGGLAVASALRDAATEVVLFERAPAFAPIGAGIVLAANAVNALRSLGIDPVPRGRPLLGMSMRTAAGRLLSGVNPAEVCPEAPAIGIHRAALHEVLIGALPPGAEVRMGRTIASLTQTADRVDVALDDGTAESFDHLIGADGLHSSIRALLGGPTPEYSGYSCWRAVVDGPEIEAGCEWWGRGRRFGAVPLPGGQAYLYLTGNTPPSAPTPDLVAAFADFEAPVRALVGRIDPGALLHHDLSDLPRPLWGVGRVWLLGDAAHAILPNEGQGAAMAIEDAVALRVASRERTSDAALARYVSLRDARVRRIHRDSRWLGRVGQWESRLAVGLRDRAMGLLPSSLARRQLRAVVEPGLALVGG